jgi:hypothetical protein
MRPAVIALGGIAALAAAQLVGVAARDARADWPALVRVPYAPSATAAPFLSLGYREAAADLMWIRMLGYLGGRDDTAASVHELVEATLALDDHYRPGYDVGPLAIQTASHGVDQAAHRAALSLFERGMKVFPRNWEYPVLAGQTLLVDLVPANEAQRREWMERAAAWFEKASRMPGALERVAATAAFYQDKLGKHELAVQRLQEMILIAQDDLAREQLIKQLAAIEKRDEVDVRVAMIEARRAFLDELERNRPALPAAMYILLGKRRDPYLPRQALAVDRDLIGTNPPEELESLYDDATPDPEPAPRPSGESSDTRAREKPKR